MGKIKYEMNVDKPTQMDTQQMLQLKNIYKINLFSYFSYWFQIYSQRPKRF